MSQQLSLLLLCQHPILSFQDDELQFDADGVPIDVPDAEPRRAVASARPPRARGSAAGAGTGTSEQRLLGGSSAASSGRGESSGDESRELRSRLQAVEAVRCGRQGGWLAPPGQPGAAAPMAWHGAPRSALLCWPLQHGAWMSPD